MHLVQVFFSIVLNVHQDIPYCVMDKCGANAGNDLQISRGRYDGVRAFISRAVAQPGGCIRRLDVQYHAFHADRLVDH